MGCHSFVSFGGIADIERFPKNVRSVMTNANIRINPAKSPVSHTLLLVTVVGSVTDGIGGFTRDTGSLDKSVDGTFCINNTFQGM